MLTTNRKAKMLNALKLYKKRYLDGNITDLDESGTRIMINSFLSDVLGYEPLQEIKTEYMIKGTYADYVIQTNGIRHFLVEVKAMSLQLSEKHLRQAINYGANEGIEWALLTNGRNFDFYKILFNKPIESRKVFSVDLTTATNLKSEADYLQYLQKDAINKKSLKFLWNRCEALHPMNIAGIVYSKEVVGVIKKMIRAKYNEKCDDEEIVKSLNTIMCDKIDPLLIKPFRSNKPEKKSGKSNTTPEATKVAVEKPEISKNAEETMSHSNNG